MENLFPRERFPGSFASPEFGDDGVFVCATPTALARWLNTELLIDVVKTSQILDYGGPQRNVFSTDAFRLKRLAASDALTQFGDHIFAVSKPLPNKPFARHANFLSHTLPAAEALLGGEGRILPFEAKPCTAMRFASQLSSPPRLSKESRELCWLMSLQLYDAMWVNARGAQSAIVETKVLHDRVCQRVIFVLHRSAI